MIERIVRHYKGRWRQGYVRGKLRSDPIYSSAWKVLRASALPVLDVGCGIGLLEFYLREHGFQPPMTGIDFDEEKIQQAQYIAGHAYQDLTFKVGDVFAAGGFRGNVMLLDVLHYLPADRQMPLLEQLATLVAPGGYCVIRATPQDESWRFRVTQLQEVVIHATGWMKSRAAHFPKVEEIVAPFRARGFTCEVGPLWGRTPFNSHLFVFQAPGGPASQTAQEQGEP